MSEPIAKPVLRVKDLKVHFPIQEGVFQLGERQVLKAVDGVSFEVGEGEILGLVGESGCGKSSLGRAIIRLNDITSGTVLLGDKEFSSLRGEALRKARTEIQMIFQDPYGSLDPRMTVYDILREPIASHSDLSSKETTQQLNKILDLVKLSKRALKKFPHEFSGGQRQRVAIARALVLNPKVIIADEPVSALDVSVQAHILNLMKDIQKELGLSMIFISHNLAVVRYITNRIAVMYLGKIVEVADRETLYKNPQHPYTQALVAAVPIPDPKLARSRDRKPLEGELPSPTDPPSGCAFHGRCPLVMDKCKQDVPSLKGTTPVSHEVSCFAVEG